MTLRRMLLAAFVFALASPAIAETFRLGDQNAKDKLTIWASTDPGGMDALIRAFLQERPKVAVEYRNLQSSELYQDIRDGRLGAPDIAISAAANLQVKLANDGYALTHRPRGAIDLPQWAKWRDQAFGVAVEPAVIVYNKQVAALGPLPRTRLDLAAALLQHKDVLAGKVATYDIAKSGIGYLFAAEDSFYSSTFTTLTQTFGQVNTRTYCCSNEMLDLLDKGEMLVGYNILGSYALAKRSQGSSIDIVLPQDYTLMLSRVAILPVGAGRSDLGAAFLDFLLSPRAKALAPQLADYDDASQQSQTGFTMHPIRLDPTLLVFLDRVKQSRFTQTWRRLIGVEN